jgi:UDP-N-acetyl-D-glucosamine dehydrogenase
MNKIDELLEKICTKKARCAVVGLGYVGLPLLCEFAKADFETIGIDIDESKISDIKRGVSYIQDISNQELKKIVKTGRLKADTNYSVLNDVDVVSVCVPTPLRKSKTPDISYIVEACSKIAKYLHKGQLIILESTTYPGTTEEIVLPILTKKFKYDEYSEICESRVLTEMRSVQQKKDVLGKKQEKMQAGTTIIEGNEHLSSFNVGSDFFLAFSPERVDPGNLKFKTKDIPKVIGGFTPACSEVSAAFYKHIFSKVVKVSSTRTAEMVKLLENTFRSVNIALANEMSLMCDSLKVDVWEVIEAAATKPFGFMPFYPGPGLGGHCIPVDPFYLTWKVRMNGFDPKFVEGAKITYYDPYVSEINIDGINMRSVEFSKIKLKKSDCLIITTDHSNIDYEVIANNCSMVIDTRNALRRYEKLNI